MRSSRAILKLSINCCKPIFDVKAYAKAKSDGRMMATGLPAGPGAASGAVVFTAGKAEELAAKGQHVVLARIETSPEDLRGMIASDGILTARGGVSSHAALVARQMGKVCVAGAGDIEIDYHKKTLKCNGVTLKEGDPISINGSTGEVFNGKIDTADSELKQVLVAKTMKPGDSKVFQYYNFIMKLADKFRRLGIRTNADQPDQVENAVAFGAEGIGLCRTEHMFFEGDRIIAVRQMILAKNEEDRKAALAKLLPYQQKDFEGIFRALNGLPACIRLLDPPLHEFLPQHDNKKGQQEVADQLGIKVDEVKKLVTNCMSSIRCLVSADAVWVSCDRDFRDASSSHLPGGCSRAEGRYQGQARDHGSSGWLQEGTRLASRDHPSSGAEVMKETGKKFAYSVGTMIEVPRGA